jgi:uridine kinase
MLIQTDRRQGAPSLHYCMLPKDISSRYVLLCDAIIGTGAAAIMAIRVLLDYQCDEDKIIFLCLIASPVGIHNISQAFPKVYHVLSNYFRSE